MSWTHYETPVSLGDSDKRGFYLAGAIKNNWSARQRERQVSSHLFGRLLPSNDLATALLTHLQESMLELGNGFSFVARQRCLHLDGNMRVG